jgi:hypothetical protein
MRRSTIVERAGYDEDVGTGAADRYRTGDGAARQLDHRHPKAVGPAQEIVSVRMLVVVGLTRMAPKVDDVLSAVAGRLIRCL